jgi:hypothetical protein
MDKIKALKERFMVLASDAKYIKEGMDEFHEWNSITKLLGNLGKLYDFMHRAVLVMEASARDILSIQGEIQGRDKRKALVEALDAMIVLPVYLEPFDGPLLQILVDFSVRSLNDRLGHDWGVPRILDWILRGKDLLDYAGGFVKR